MSKLKLVTYDGVRFTIRHPSISKTDENVIKEVFGGIYRRRKIDFDVEPGETWIDLGANIGAFAGYCEARKAKKVHCFEPDDDCFEILQKNLGRWKIESTTAKTCVTDSNEPRLTFYQSNDGKFSRGSTTPVRTLPVTFAVANTHFRFLPGFLKEKRVDGIKMDIEGSEGGILDNLDKLIPCDKIALEYHLSRDTSWKSLRRRLSNLQDIFATVSYPPEFDRIIESKKDTKSFFDRMIFAKDRK